MGDPHPGPDQGPGPDETPEGAAAEPSPSEGPPVEVPDDLSGLDDLPPAEGEQVPGEVPGEQVAGAPSVEDLVELVETLTVERDGYLDRWQRATADFENSKRRLQRDAEDASARATGRLAEDLLPVLDACDAAISHGETAVEPVFAALLQILEKNGLERIDPTGDVFDPTRHEAVMHEPAGPDDDPALSLVSEVLRIGYAWKGRVVRAAMVKVRG